MKLQRFLFPRFLFLLLALMISFTAGRVAAQSGNEPYRATIGSDGVQHVNILAGDYFFRPKHIIVKVNVPVMLVVRVEQGVIPHGLVLKVPKANILIVSLKHSLLPRPSQANMLSIAQRSCSFSRAIGSTGWRGFWKLSSSRRGLRLSSCVSTRTAVPSCPGNGINTATSVT